MWPFLAIPLGVMIYNTKLITYDYHKPGSKYERVYNLLQYH